ncbi:hypothetical protein KGQ19_26250 [Catenulispora sp. NL8]|uniref:Uncharacterized protein n=1 Tax=Catenulispora pinistramenti TaxID=2705254 RepID=A0ABS5KWE2_9ACTN|nr:hypothetical protein [Catenulispora pinistramenti]MBS2550377.1 hypothetical protein [Catenulispora pinistramenti]
MIDHREQRNDETPTPNIVGAWFVLGAAASERVPWWAGQWLAEGHDGPTLRELAGLNGRDPHAVTDLLPAALAELGVSMPTTVTAAASEAFRYTAELHLSGQASARWVAQQVEQIIIRTDYSNEVFDLPLGLIYGVDDEWEGGWGRTVEELKADIHAKCVEQLLGSSMSSSAISTVDGNAGADGE